MNGFPQVSLLYRRPCDFSIGRKEKGTLIMGKMRKKAFAREVDRCKFKAPTARDKKGIGAAKPKKQATRRSPEAKIESSTS